MQGRLQETAASDFAGGPLGLYILGVSFSRLSGLPVETSAVAVSALLFVAILLIFLALAMQFAGRRTHLGLLATLGFLTIPAAYLHLYEYTTSNLGMLAFLALLVCVSSKGSPYESITTAMIFLLLISFSHVGTFTFMFIFLPLMAGASILLRSTTNWRSVGAMALVVALPFIFLTSSTAFPYTEQAYLTRFQVSVENKVQLLFGTALDPPLSILYEMFSRPTIQSAAITTAYLVLVALAFLPLRMLAYSIGTRVGGRISSRLALAAFPPLNLPQYLERNIGYLALLLGPAHLVLMLFQRKEAFPRDHLPVLSPLVVVGVIAGLSALGGANPTAREFTFVWILLGWMAGCGLGNLLVNNGASFERLRRLLGAGLLAGMTVSTAVGGIVYLPAITALPVEREAAVWVDTQTGPTSVILAPNFDARLKSGDPVYVVPVDALSDWNRASTALFYGEQWSKRALSQWFDSAYAIGSDKVARQSGIQGDIEGTGSYDVFALGSEHLHVFKVV